MSLPCTSFLIMKPWHALSQDRAVVACMLSFPGQARTKQDWISPTESGWAGLGPAGLGSLERVRVTCTIPAGFQEALLQASAATVRPGHTRRARVG